MNTILQINTDWLSVAGSSFNVSTDIIPQIVFTLYNYNPIQVKTKIAKSVHEFTFEGVTVQNNNNKIIKNSWSCLNNCVHRFMSLAHSQTSWQLATVVEAEDAESDYVNGSSHKLLTRKVSGGWCSCSYQISIMILSGILWILLLNVNL